MKKIIIVFSLMFLGAIWSFAQEDQTNKLEISGDFFSDQRVMLNKDKDWAWNENRLTLKAKKQLGTDSKFSSEVWIRNLGIPQYSNLSSLYNKNIVSPYNFELREAYFQVSNLLIKNLDLTIGRQIIAWGTADRINPTNSFNPYDFEDILDFGRRRGTDAFRVQYYATDFLSFEAVLAPLFQPANLPVGLFSPSFTQSFDLQPGMNVVGLYDNLILPEFNFKETITYGAKIKCSFVGIDLSASYVYGRDFLPTATYVKVTPVDYFGNVSIQTNLEFVKQHVFGMDLSTSILGIGLWAEFALTKPVDDVVMQIDVSDLYPFATKPVIIDSVLIAKDEPYLKYVIGMDYHFPFEIYANIQYVHGFMHERGKNELNDYILVNVDKSFFYDKLKIAPLSGAIIISDYNDLSNNFAFAYIPQITYKPTPNAELIFSTTIFDGKGNNLFTDFYQKNLFMLKFKYSF